MSADCAPDGGAFLIEDADLDQILTVEEMPSEARFMAKSVEDFMRKEVLAVTDRLEEKEPGLMKSLLQKGAELGILSTLIPEKYDGLELKKSWNSLIMESVALEAGFAVSLGAHCSIGTLPVLFFGTEEQRKKYVPGLASGKIIGAFCLSEAGSGSDALNCAAKAVLSEDGKHYILNGTKMWVTNGGFADLYTIFAKVDGEQFTAFLVERGLEGITLGKEEHKLGIKGSSTCRVILDNVKVPVENVLGEVGKGHRPALYSLNIGRFNIGVGSLSGGKEILKISTQYAKQRKQFGKPIAEFGLIQQKIGQMAALVYVLESMIYRVAGYYDVKFAGLDVTNAADADKIRAAAEEYSIECAIMKFFGSEALAYFADEGLQIHGGYGFTEEFPMARAYRDARIQRIFEGTNEINRLAVVMHAFKRAMQGRLDLLGAGAQLKDYIMNWQPGQDAGGSLDPVEEIGVWVTQLRRATMFAAGRAIETLGPGGLEDKQEIVGAISEMAANLLGLESAWLRLQKLQKKALPANFELALAATQVFGCDAMAKSEELGRFIVAALFEDTDLKQNVSILKRLIKPPVVDTLTARRKLAAAAIDKEAYPLG
jgi:alkylation response protein AidB-like acyl-CoA dehydrogenase